MQRESFVNQNSHQFISRRKNSIFLCLESNKKKERKKERKLDIDTFHRGERVHASVVLAAGSVCVFPGRSRATVAFDTSINTLVAHCSAAWSILLYRRTCAPHPPRPRLRTLAWERARHTQRAKTKPYKGSLNPGFSPFRDTQHFFPHF